MKRFLNLVALLSLAAAQSPDRSIAAVPRCVPIDTLVSPAMFKRYPATAAWHGLWQKPDVRSGKAHLYRTVLRSEGAGPPDFAGYLKVVRHGCGAGMTCPLFLNLRTGKVVFEPAIESVGWDLDIEEVAGENDLRLVYRADSRLLVAVGSRNERLNTIGAKLFEWRGDHLQLMRFIPVAVLCRDHPVRRER
jgi:hypothetical protein